MYLYLICFHVTASFVTPSYEGFVSPKLRSCIMHYFGCMSTFSTTCILDFSKFEHPMMVMIWLVSILLGNEHLIIIGKKRIREEELGAEQRSEQEQSLLDNGK